MGNHFGCESRFAGSFAWVKPWLAQGIVMTKLEVIEK